MNTTRFEELLLAYEDNVLSTEELAEFKQLLAASPTTRRRLVESSVMYNIAASHTIPDKVIEIPDKKLPLGVKWIPLTSVAAGIMLGVFCTTLVYGYVLPREAVTTSRIINLFDGGFEKSTGRLDAHIPKDFGKWSGNESDIVEGRAIAGKKALRFIKGEPNEPHLISPSKACDVFQLVDLRSMKATSSDSETILELSAQFLDARDLNGDEITFICFITVFSGSPEEMRNEDALARGSAIVRSTGGEPEKWHSVKAKVTLPQDADFAMVQILAKKESTKDNEAAEFGEQFADDVQLALKSQPPSP